MSTEPTGAEQQEVTSDKNKLEYITSTLTIVPTADWGSLCDAGNK